MIKSMTGYGRAKYDIEERQYCIEMKSVNHKYCDISIKIPRNISYLEEYVKEIISSNVSRGKIDVFISFNNNSTKGKKITINRELSKTYIDELKKIAEENNIDSNIPVTEISKFPDVLTIENVEDEELIKQELELCVKEALTGFLTMRENEGQKMCEDVEKRINSISEKIDKILEYSTGLIEEYVVKLEKRIKEILKTDIVDEARLAQEVVIYADKCSVQEEITRMKSHMNQFKNLLKKEGPVGKKLDFIIQEMNRETNTIASKANCIDITNLVIDIKTEIENIREQVQNIE